MHFKIKNDTLIIDEDDHYWTGIINQFDFPEEIRDNYLDIIEKSFDNFINEEYSVTRNFEDPSKEDTTIYIINFHYKSKPFSFKRTIEIPMMLKNKDFKDYTNERIEKLEEEIKKLHETFQTLQLNIDKKIEMLQVDKEEEEVEEGEEEVEEEGEEGEEEEEEEEEEVEVPIKMKGVKLIANPPIYTINKNARQKQK
jgi:hypothetical protein